MMPGDIDIVSELEDAVIQVLKSHGITCCNETKRLVAVSMMQLAVSWASDGQGDREDFRAIVNGLLDGMNYMDLAKLLAKFAGVPMLLEDLQMGVDLPAKDRPS